MENTPRLILVPTPIGNLDDISLRALDAFKTCDEVYCEDTRVTGKLLSCYDIKKPLFRMDENSIDRVVGEVISKIESGKTICFCSDAGMPGISDPGSRIVEACHKSDVKVEVLPGANACLTALVASGFNTTHFYFEGFLPKKKGQRKTRLEFLFEQNLITVIYESPNRVQETVEMMAEIAPERRICVARELTKLHEQVLVDTSKNMLDKLNELSKNNQCRGEFVLVIDEISEQMKTFSKNARIEQASKFAEEMFELGATKSQVRAYLIDYFGLSKNEAYELSI
ncbi:MAG: 16S rRNA (cytidine(1402)-2'-O)-methyltransferase [Phoenicibacter congonensis]|uniref:Ribosomal RNA small subunit methyltransferase I n=1 Tax=Phoenicibacter congonensis TaxID=1944646 RepID=A0AA43RGN9_9ACTN|nr:16S rRNA (cytidine(1402)-2'-O)-methyltransferase [Phoenicibacter congonensis]